MTEREKMLAGELYDARDPELQSMRRVVLDVAPVTIGGHVLFGPVVQLYIARSRRVPRGDLDQALVARTCYSWWHPPPLARSQPPCRP